MIKMSAEKLSSAKPTSSSAENRDPITAALLRTIQEKSQEDPLIGAKVGAQEIRERLINAMKTEKGVHIESLLCALGALAGYACQANLRVQAEAKGIPENAIFRVVTTNDGKKYFFGEPLNSVLVRSQYSVWSLAAAAAKDAGCLTLPDINEMFGHSAKVLGSSEYGIPRTPENHRPHDKPVNYVKALWPPLFPIVKLFCSASVHWPILFGLTIQEIIVAGMNIIDPGLALKIVMESAIAMSQIDLGNV
jgi:hypothetical protein